MTPESRNWLDWALRYAEQGWRVLPLQPASKQPYLGTAGKSDASRDPDQFTAWLEAAEEIGEGTPNLGIVPPEGCAVIDVDPRDGGTLPEGLPVTLTQRSGGGGWHVVVRVGDTPVRGTMGPGVQVKTHSNGYIVAEPSIHPSGAPYVWERTTDKIATCPEPILDRIRRRSREETCAEFRPDVRVGRLTVEKITAMAETLAAALHSGQKHATVLAYGGWAKQQSVHPDDVAEIVEKALTTEGTADDVTAGVETALWAFESEDTRFGWQQLNELLSAEECAALEATSPLKAASAESARRIREVWERIAARTPTTPQRRTPEDPKLDWHGAGRVVPWDSEIRPIESLVDGFPVYRGESNALIGNPSAGKTPTALTLALAVSCGAPWMGRETTKARTAYVTYESPEATFALAKKLSRANGWATENVGFVENLYGALASFEGQQALIEAVAAEGVEFLVIETYDSACAGLDNNNDAAYSLPMKALHIPNVATLVSVHCRKSTSGRPPRLEDIGGTGALGASIKGAIGIHRPEATDEHLFELTCARARNKHFAACRLRYVDTPDGVRMDPEAMPEVPTEAPKTTKPSAAQVKRDEERIALDAVRRWAVGADPTVWVGLSDVVQAAAVPVGREAVGWALEQAAKDGPPLIRWTKRESVLWYRPTTQTERDAMRPLGKVVE